MGATSASIARFARSVIRRGAGVFDVSFDFAASASETTSTTPPRDASSSAPYTPSANG